MPRASVGCSVWQEGPWKLPLLAQAVFFRNDHRKALQAGPWIRHSCLIFGWPCDPSPFCGLMSPDVTHSPGVCGLSIRVKHNLGTDIKTAKSLNVYGKRDSGSFPPWDAVAQPAAAVDPLWCWNVAMMTESELGMVSAITQGPLASQPRKAKDLTTVSIPEDKRELMNIHFRPCIFSKPLPNESQFSPQGLETLSNHVFESDSLVDCCTYEFWFSSAHVLISKKILHLVSMWEAPSFFTHVTEWGKKR